MLLSASYTYPPHRTVERKRVETHVTVCSCGVHARRAFPVQLRAPRTEHHIVSEMKCNTIEVVADIRSEHNSLSGGDRNLSAAVSQRSHPVNTTSHSAQLTQPASPARWYFVNRPSGPVKITPRRGPAGPWSSTDTEPALVQRGPALCSSRVYWRTAVCWRTAGEGLSDASDPITLYNFFR
jgi:hypothetical protein